MDSIQQLMQQARKAGFAIVMKPGESPRWSPLYPLAKMPGELLEKLKEHRDAIMDWLGQPRRKADVADDWQDTCRVCECHVYPAIVGHGCAGLTADGIVNCPYRPKVKR